MSHDEIDDRFILDPTVIEESCSDSKITIAVNPTGHICSIFKDGVGGIDASLLTEMIHVNFSFFIGIDFQKDCTQHVSTSKSTAKRKGGLFRRN
jgi:exosome complex component RRP42